MIVNPDEYDEPHDEHDDPYVIAGTNFSKLPEKESQTNKREKAKAETALDLLSYTFDAQRRESAKNFYTGFGLLGTPPADIRIDN